MKGYAMTSMMLAPAAVARFITARSAAWVAPSWAVVTPASAYSIWAARLNSISCSFVGWGRFENTGR